jgi:CBS domain-containing membrane protein
MEIKTVADFMTRKLVTVSERDTLESLEELMRRLRLRHLPVVDHQNQLIGLITHRDLLSAAASWLTPREAEENAVIQQLPVRRIMQHEVLTVQPEDSLIEAGKLMWDSKIGCLPVVDADGALVGILTETDFIRIAVRLLGDEIAKPDVEELARTPSRIHNERP